MKPSNKWVKTVVMAMLAIGITGFANIPHLTKAAVQQTKIPVLVMAEDSDPASVKRSSAIFRRVMSGLKDSMSRYGFRMMDEEFLAVELDWNITERYPKATLIQAVKLANAVARADTRSRIMVLLRLHASLQKLNFSNKAAIRIEGEIYDINNNNFLGTFALNPKAYPAPVNCDSICISEVFGTKARGIAEDLGDILARKLNYLHNTRANLGNSASGTGNGSTENPGIPSYAESNIPNTHTLHLKFFDTREALSIIGVMSDEFPGYINHELLSKGAVNRSYAYVTTAKTFKLEKWLNILLLDMGFDIDRQIEIIVQGNEITVYKSNPTPKREGFEDEAKRFN